MSIVKLEQPPDVTRVESGPVQFGDDWPGIFIRGDNAMYMSMAIKQAADSLRGQPFLAAELDEIAKELGSCDARSLGHD